MDSGVGVKAYAVIEQGKIGQILGARPMERRQLLEEAAGVTKYKSRRRAAELKIEAARQNLTRVDDIIFEIDNQRNALKRQAAKARRYRLLRKGLRRWEKVQLARASLALEETIEATERHLADARAPRAGGGRHGWLSWRRRTSGTGLHLRRLIRPSPPPARRRTPMSWRPAGSSSRSSSRRSRSLRSTRRLLRSKRRVRRSRPRRSPLHEELGAQVEAARRCAVEWESAAEELRAAEAAHRTAQAAVEGIESDVEAARSAAFAAVNAAAVLRNVVQNAAEACDRVDAEIAHLAAEAADLATESAKLAAARKENAAAVARVRAVLDKVRAERADREARLAAANEARHALAADARARERELANVSARIASLDALIAAREGYGDAARLVLTAPEGELQHLGAVADHLEADREHELIVEAGLGDLLHALVVRHERDARAAMAFVAARGAGRCDFLITEVAEAEPSRGAPPDAALIPLTDLLRVNGPAAAALRGLLARHWLAPSFEAASAAARTTNDTIVTPDGAVFHGAALVRGGGRSEEGGILRLRGELKELRVRQASEQAAVRRLAEDQDALDADAARVEAELKALQGDEHAREKKLLEAELRLARWDDENARLTRRRELIRNEDRRAREEREARRQSRPRRGSPSPGGTMSGRRAEARQRDAQQQLMDARSTVQTLNAPGQRVQGCPRGAGGRAAGLEADVGRIKAAAADLDRRVQDSAAGRRRRQRPAGSVESIHRGCWNPRRRRGATARCATGGCPRPRRPRRRVARPHRRAGAAGAGRAGHARYVSRRGRQP